MELSMKDPDITEADIPNPEACGGPQSGGGVCADQKPQQVMMNELSQRENTDVTATRSIHVRDIIKILIRVDKVIPRGKMSAMNPLFMGERR